MPSAIMVKTLREKTGAGILDCSKALSKNGDDIDAAIRWLREKGITKASSKSERPTTQGVIGIAISQDKKTAVAIELNTETDFVARNKQFQDLSEAITKVALNFDNIEELSFALLPSGKTVKDEILNHIAIIGENINLRRLKRFSISNGILNYYIHNAATPNLGNIGAIVALESKSEEKLNLLAEQLSIHVAASNPKYIYPSDVNKDLVAKEREVYLEQIRDSGKAIEIQNKIVDGKVKQFIEEISLMTQPFVFDSKTKVADVILEVEKKLNDSIKVAKFIRFSLGEEIDEV